MLNVIYKIGSACIATRLKLVLPKLVNEDQTGFIRGRYIGDNIRLIYDMIDYLNKKDLPGLLLNLDFEKAFDSLSWNFMLKVLKAFGFGPDICKWVHLFIQILNPQSLLMVVPPDGFQLIEGVDRAIPFPLTFLYCVLRLWP